ncbi:MAG: hypothetical protein Q8Q25_03070 [bacterium]|nr:hypothetical protein [bacterium]
MKLPITSLISFYTIRKICQKPQGWHAPALSPGFLLIEALFAVSLLVVLSLSLAYYQGAIAQWQQEALCRFQAVSLASNLMDQVIKTGKVPESRQEGAFKVSWQPFFNTIAGFQLFKLTVAWGFGDKSVTMYTGIVHGNKKG